MDASSGAIKWKVKEVGDVTGETVTVNQWNYVQVDFASSSVKISVNGQTLGTLPQPGSDGENIFTSGQTLKIGDADSADSVADEADRSFLGYIDDLSIDTIYGAFPNITVPNVERSGNYFTNAFNLTTATGTPVINSEGNITSVNITNSGSGYTTEPTVTFSLPTNGVQATAVATLSGDRLNRIYITNAGAGYEATPIITIGSPLSLGVGTYFFNERVVGSLSGTEGYVKIFNEGERKLEIAINNGVFTPGEFITGTASSARYQVLSHTGIDTASPYTLNDEIETAADDILDFTEIIPFGNF